MQKPSVTISLARTLVALFMITRGNYKVVQYHQKRPVTRRESHSPPIKEDRGLDNQPEVA